MKEEMRACGVCGKLHPVSELMEFDDTLICRDCLQTETVRCQRCGVFDKKHPPGGLVRPRAQQYN